MMRISLIPLAILITGCINVPATVKIHDDQPMVVTQDSETGRNTLYKNTLLDHYNVDGRDTYCINLMTTRTDLYHCFAHNNGYLTHGLHPTSMKWEQLPSPIPINPAGN